MNCETREIVNTSGMSDIELMDLQRKGFQSIPDCLKEDSATLGAPLDITLQEMLIESAFPADPDSEKFLRDLNS